MKQRVMLDTNIVLDAVAQRNPHAAPAILLFTCVERGILEGAVCALTLTTLDYIASKSETLRPTRPLIERITKLFAVAAVDREVVEAALASEVNDFEDAVQIESARRIGCSHFITRDKELVHIFATQATATQRDRFKVCSPSDFLLEFNAVR